MRQITGSDEPRESSASRLHPLVGQLQFQNASGCMPDSGNLNDLFFGLDPVHDSTGFAKYLSDLCVVKLGNNPA